MAVAARYIRSDLKLSSDADPTPANSIGIDISGFTTANFKLRKKIDFDMDLIYQTLAQDLNTMKVVQKTSFQQILK